MKLLADHPYTLFAQADKLALGTEDGAVLEIVRSEQTLEN